MSEDDFEEIALNLAGVKWRGMNRFVTEARRARQAEAALKEQYRLAHIDSIQNEARANDAEAERDRLREALREIDEEGGRYNVITLRAIAREARAGGKNDG